TGGGALVATSSGGTLDGVTVNGDLNLTADNSQLTVLNGLTLNGTATLAGYRSRLSFAGTQTLGGSGTVVFGNVFDNLLQVANGSVLAIGNPSWSSSGSLAATAGGTLGLAGSFTLAASTTISVNGGTVNLTGSLDNTGGTLTLNVVAGSWRLLGGTIKGG